jgi:hypothetical protein
MNANKREYNNSGFLYLRLFAFIRGLFPLFGAVAA